MAASGTTINAQIPAVPNSKCQLCEENKIKWKCFDCEEYMCDQCKKVHLKSRATSNHKIATMYGSYTGEEQVDVVHTSCGYHPTEYVILFCQECEEFLCKDCIASGSHKTHKIMKIDTIITEKSEKLSKIMSRLSEKISSLKAASEEVKKMCADYSHDSENCTEAVKSRNALLKSKIDVLTDCAIEKLQTNQKKYQEKLTEKDDEIAHAITELTTLFDNCRAKQTKREIGLVQFIKDIEIREMTLKNIPVPEVTDSPTFVSTEVVDADLGAIFGQIKLQAEPNTNDEETLLSLATDSNSSDNAISSPPELVKNPTTDAPKVLSTIKIRRPRLVAALSDKLAWVGFSGSDKHDKIALVASDQHVTKNASANLMIYDMAVNKSGELLVCEGTEGKYIKKMTSDCKLFNFYGEKDGPSIAGIAMTDGNEIIVGLNIFLSDSYKVVKLDQNGELISTTEYENTSFVKRLVSKTRLFGYICNVNGDIIVVQTNYSTTPKRNSVVVVDKDGHKRFTYDGDGSSLEKPFNPRYTVTDKHGHILISDYNNSVIHMLDTDGHFIGFAMTKQHGLQGPHGLSIDNEGNLWVCSCKNDKIMVVRYV